MYPPPGGRIPMAASSWTPVGEEKPQAGRKARAMTRATIRLMRMTDPRVRRVLMVPGSPHCDRTHRIFLDPPGHTQPDSVIYSTDFVNL